MWSATILTTTATGPAGEIHDRTPLTLPPSLLDSWLDPDRTDGKEATSLLADVEFAPLEPRMVAPLVNKVANNGPELIEPAEAVRDQPLQLALN